MTNKIKINGKTTYLVLLGIILVLSSFIVYAVPSDIGHSINEIDWANSEIAHLQVANLVVRDTIEITDLPLGFSSGLTSNQISADEDLFADTFFTASQVRAHELYLGPDYATASFISDWDNLSSISDNNIWIPFEPDPIKIDWNGNSFEWDAGGTMYGVSHQINPACDAAYAGNRRYKVVGAQPNSEWQDSICSWNGVGYTWSGSWGKTNPDLRYDTYINKYYTYPQGVGDEFLEFYPTKFIFGNGEGECYECGPDDSDDWVCEIALHVYTC